MGRVGLDDEAFAKNILTFFANRINRNRLQLFFIDAEDAAKEAFKATVIDEIMRSHGNKLNWGLISFLNLLVEFLMMSCFKFSEE